MKVSVTGGAGFVEKIGSGIGRMRDLVPFVTFEISSNWFRTVFARGIDVGENVGEKLSQTERRKQIIVLLKQDSTLTILSLSKKLNVNPKTIERDLLKLQDKVTYVGSAKGGHWEVV